jgi:hypothetical protein
MPRIESRVNELIATIEKRLDKRTDEIVAQARRALRLSLIEGAIHLQDMLEAAHTATGNARVEAGGLSAGRHGENRPGHTGGNMVASVSHNGDRLRMNSSKEIIGSFGWFRAEYEEYFHWQDLGTRFIPAAEAMDQAAALAREHFKVRMIHIMQGHPGEM